MIAMLFYSDARACELLWLRCTDGGSSTNEPSDASDACSLLWPRRVSLLLSNPAVLELGSSSTITLRLYTNSSLVPLADCP